jgi:hypothetical protein
MWIIGALVTGFIGGCVFMFLFERRNKDTVAKAEATVDKITTSK